MWFFQLKKSHDKRLGVGLRSVQLDGITWLFQVKKSHDWSTWSLCFCYHILSFTIIISPPITPYQHHLLPMSSIQCTSCNAFFTGKPSAHSNTCLADKTMVLPDGRVAILEVEDGLFVCECSYMGGCNKSFSGKPSMKKHMKKEGTEWLGTIQVSPLFQVLISLLF